MRKVILGDEEESARQWEALGVGEMVEEAVCEDKRKHSASVIWFSRASVECAPGRGEEGLCVYQAEECGFGNRDGSGDPLKHSNQRKDVAPLCLKTSPSCHVNNGLAMDKIRSCCQGPDERSG